MRPSHPVLLALSAESRSRLCFGWTWPEYYLPLCLGFAVFFTLLGKPCGDWAEKRFGRKDPGAFVLDEVAGYLVTVAWIEFYGWQQLVAAFFLFRLFDIWKPPPARRMEKTAGRPRDHGR